MSSSDDTKPTTLVHALKRWAEENPDTPALHTKRGDTWEHLSWSQYWDNARAVAKALIAMGHEPGDCVAIVGANRPEWVQYQMGIMAARGIPAPIYTTNTEEQAAFIVSNSRARIAIGDTAPQLEKYLSAEKAELFPRLEKLLSFDAVDLSDERLMSFEEIIALGAKQSDDELDQRLSQIADDETCMLIYTSGTTGTPKGVMLDHGGEIEMAYACLEQFPQFFSGEVPYRSVSYLPLCHQAEQLFTVLYSLVTGGQVYFCPDMTEVKDYLVAARPTIFLGVPRVWEKFEAALRAKLAEATGFKAWMAGWAMRTELSAFKRSVELGDPDYTTFGRNMARKLVIDKIKDKLGLDQVAIAVTGAAPIAVSTQEFFASLGICIYEGYGMSETTGVATVSDRLRPRFGTVGKPVRCSEVRIAEDGEVQLKGRNMTKGYLHMPEATAELYTEDGWLCTGDLGELDEEGNLKITGRKKELLITAGGKNVAPVEMENYIKAIAGVGQVVVVGDRKPYLCALIALDPEGLDDLCERLSIDKAPMAELAKHDKVHAYLQDEIERVCNPKVAKYQTIKKITVLPVEMSVDGGELTPTMKLRRSVIADKYESEIEGMYAGAAEKPQPAASA